MLVHTLLMKAFFVVGYRPSTEGLTLRAYKGTWTSLSLYNLDSKLIITFGCLMLHAHTQKHWNTTFVDNDIKDHAIISDIDRGDFHHCQWNIGSAKVGCRCLSLFSNPQIYLHQEGGIYLCTKIRIEECSTKGISHLKMQNNLQTILESWQKHSKDFTKSHIKSQFFKWKHVW